MKHKFITKLAPSADEEAAKAAQVAKPLDEGPPVTVKP